MSRTTDNIETASAAASYFDSMVKAIAVVLYTLMILVVGVQILTRWVLVSVIDSSLPWTINLSQMLLVYVTFIGAAVASGKREHISLNLLSSRLSDSQLRALTAVQNILILIFVSVLVAGAYALYQQNTGSPIGALPSRAPFTQAWLYVPAIGGGVAILVYSLRDIWELLAEPERILADLRDDEHSEN